MITVQIKYNNLKPESVDSHSRDVIVHAGLTAGASWGSPASCTYIASYSYMTSDSIFVSRDTCR